MAKPKTQAKTTMKKQPTQAKAVMEVLRHYPKENMKAADISKIIAQNNLWSGAAEDPQ